MTVYQLIQALSVCDADAEVHFCIDIDGDSNNYDYVSFDEIYDADTDVDIRLTY